MKNLIQEWLKKYLILEGQYDEGIKDYVKPNIWTHPKTGVKYPQFSISSDDDKKSFSHKDIYKKHGGTWYNNDQAWKFTAFDNDVKKVLKGQIEPALQEVAKRDGNIEEINPEEIASIIKLLEEQMSELLSGVPQKSGDDIEKKLEELKNKFISITSAQEFKDFMRPILNFRRTSKYKYSILNTILIWLQDSEATFVLSLGKWRKNYNHEINDNAKIITLCVPNQIKIKKKVKNEDGTEEVKEISITKSFTFRKTFTDIRFTHQMEGKENILKDYEEGKKRLSELKWHEDGTVDDELKTLINAVEMVCKDEGINIEKVKKETLGGALGVSMNGGKTIKLIDGQEVNEGFVKTAVHELTHSLCHWENSRFKLQKDYSHQEQEAEMCAWAVLCVFGYEATTDASMNYIGAWGLTEETAKEVFERMGVVITYIVNKIQEKIDTI